MMQGTVMSSIVTRVSNQLAIAGLLHSHAGMSSANALLGTNLSTSLMQALARSLACTPFWNIMQIICQHRECCIALKLHCCLQTAASGCLTAFSRGFASKATKGGATGAGPRKQGQQQGPDEANIGERRPEGFPKHVEVPEGRQQLQCACTL